MRRVGYGFKSRLRAHPKTLFAIRFGLSLCAITRTALCEKSQMEHLDHKTNPDFFAAYLDKASEEKLAQKYGCDFVSKCQSRVYLTTNPTNTQFHKLVDKFDKHIKMRVIAILKDQKGDLQGLLLHSAEVPQYSLWMTPNESPPLNEWKRQNIQSSIFVKGKVCMNWRWDNEQGCVGYTTKCSLCEYFRQSPCALVFEKWSACNELRDLDTKCEEYKKVLEDCITKHQLWHILRD